MEQKGAISYDNCARVNKDKDYLVWKGINQRKIIDHGYLTTPWEQKLIKTNVSLNKTDPQS